MLTPRQHELLVFIEEQIKRTGISPTFAEMAKAMGLKSTAGIFRILTALEERGFVRRLPQRARSIEVLRRPNDDLAAEAIEAIRLRKRAREVGIFDGEEIWDAAAKAEDAVLAKWEAAHG